MMKNTSRNQISGVSNQSTHHSPLTTHHCVKARGAFTSTSEKHANIRVRGVRAPSKQTPKGFTPPREKENNNSFLFSSNVGGANPRPHRGFTLIEMMVAISIFSMVMLIGVGALLTLVETNRRAQAINSVVNNMNAALESMSRSIRVGSTYYCQTLSATPPAASTLAQPQDCATGGGLLFAFEAADGDRGDVNDQIVYRLNGTQLERSKQSGANGTWVALTAPEVTVDSFEFFVVGAEPLSSGDTIQPRVLMKIQGSAPVPGGSTNFNVQASVTQRLIDI